MRAGSISASHAAAGASKPSSWASTPASASGPLTRLAGADVLPLEQEAHVVARLDRLDLAAQALERVAMDARQQVPLAPLDAAGAAAA